MQYVRYMFVGGAIAIGAILLRELLSLFLTDSPTSYTISIFTAYTIGIYVSFLLQQKITFGNLPPTIRKKKLYVFTAIAIAIAMFSAMLAHSLRYILGFDHYFGTFSPSIAFVASVFVGSIASFLLNKYCVFNIK